MEKEQKPKTQWLKKAAKWTLAVTAVTGCIVLAKKNQSLIKETSVLKGIIRNQETTIYGQTKTINKQNYQLGKLAQKYEQQ